jgi:leucyl aminopeptidase
MVVALGGEYCGTFSNDDRLWKQLDAAGAETGELLWRMPVNDAFRKSMESQVADLRNTSTMGRNAGASTAAGFLEHFVEDKRPWAHLDIAGMAWGGADHALAPKPAYGFGVRLLDRFVADHYE